MKDYQRWQAAVRKKWVIARFPPRQHGSVFIDCEVGDGFTLPWKTTLADSVGY